MKASLKPSPGLLLAILLAASVILMLLGPGTSGRIRGLVQWAFAPAGDGGTYLSSRLKEATAPVEPVSAEEAQRLRDENAELLRRLEALERSLNAHASALTGGDVAWRQVFSAAYAPHQDVPVRLIAARVVGGDSVAYGWTRLTNAGQRKGVDDGVYATSRALVHDRSKQLPPNLAVLSGSVLAGRVTESSAFASRLQLVNDPSFEILASLWRVIDPDPRNRRTIQSGAQVVPLSDRNNVPIPAFAQGDGAEHLVIREVKAAHEIRKGDVLVTRPEDEKLPAAVEIGRVDRVENDAKNPGFVTVYVRPAIDPAALRQVYIVVPTSVAPSEGEGD